MTSSNIYPGRVPYEGPTSGYNILIVGEAPGSEELGQGRPFIGRSGQLLERYLGRSGILRSNVRLANLCTRRPRDNRFEHLLGTDTLNEDLEILSREVIDNKPNVIIALGGWPLYFLTGFCGTNKNKPAPGTGIHLYRGSRLPAVEKFGGPTQKVFATYHPAYVLRDWAQNPVFYLDLQHAIQDSYFPELRYPEYDTFIDPPVSEMKDLMHEILSAEWLSTDIENFPDRYSCVGYSWADKSGRDKAIVLTYQHAFLLERFTKEIWESDTPKIFQYGTHDAQFIKHFHGWNVGGYYRGIGFDTFIASANIMPDFPRRLDFQTSIYTRFPYYKTDRKLWKEMADMNILWNYNAKDTVATKQVAYRQMGELKELYSA